VGFPYEQDVHLDKQPGGIEDISDEAGNGTRRDGWRPMKTHPWRRAAAGALLAASVCVGGSVFAQKPGDVLRMPMGTSPASMSIHEESTIAALGPMMGVFNNLVMFDQHVPQNSLEAIVPDLAVSWSASEDGKELTFKLRPGVKWHDGKPFTSADVKCTWDLIAGKASEKLRINPRKSWYRNLEEVTTNGDDEVTFRLKRPQASFIALLASGWSPVYPCHVSPRDMRTQPIGTGGRPDGIGRRPRPGSPEHSPQYFLSRASRRRTCRRSDRRDY
jgi:peptide/nickel transport system substrate-binding protein